jgi:hypothetical protein
MIIKAQTTPVRPTYDHAALAAAAVFEPGSWFSDDDEAYPNTAPGQIRRGAMKDYRPAGAFTARRIDGRIHVAFLGVPKRPWDPTGEEPFDRLERTLNPDRCPEGTPEVLLEQLRALRQAMTEPPAKEKKERASHDDDASKKARKKKKAKKHRS